jgi:uncharacterized sulfatase
VELLDIYPTLAEVCGLEGTPPNLQGRSLRPLLDNPNAAWDKPAISQVRRASAGSPVDGYSMRSERYRYSQWNGGSLGEELYDYEKDPRELRNLATDPRVSGLKASMHQRLNEILALRRAHR